MSVTCKVKQSLCRAITVLEDSGLSASKFLDSRHMKVVRLAALGSSRL